MYTAALDTPLSSSFMDVKPDCLFIYSSLKKLPSVVFTGEVPNQSPARSLLLGQSPLNLTQNTGQFTVTQPDDMDNVSSKVDHPTMALHGVLNPRPLGRRPVKLPARFKDYVVK